MKKNFSMAIILIVLMSNSMMLNVSAEVSGDFEYWVKDGSAVITKYHGTDENIVIPNTLDDYPVIEIGEYTFLGRKRAVL